MTWVAAPQQKKKMHYFFLEFTVLCWEISIFCIESVQNLMFYLHIWSLIPSRGKSFIASPEHPLALGLTQSPIQ